MTTSIPEAGELPALPRPFVPGDEFNPRDFFSAEQMRAYALSAIAQDRAARAVPDWRTHAYVLVDIYFDGVNHAPDERCYVDGALGAAMERTRIALAATPSPAANEVAGATGEHRNELPSTN